MLSIFTLITLMLTIINGVNFTMASSDADMLTQILSEKHGAFADQGTRRDRKARQPIPQKSKAQIIAALKAPCPATLLRAIPKLRRKTALNPVITSVWDRWVQALPR